jgi:hypothetical protein
MTTVNQRRVGLYSDAARNGACVNRVMAVYTFVYGCVCVYVCVYASI